MSNKQKSELIWDGKYDEQGRRVARSEWKKKGKIQKSHAAIMDPKNNSDWRYW